MSVQEETYVCTRTHAHMLSVYAKNILLIVWVCKRRRMYVHAHTHICSVCMQRIFFWLYECDEERLIVCMNVCPHARAHTRTHTHAHAHAHTHIRSVCFPRTFFLFVSVCEKRRRIYVHAHALSLFAKNILLVVWCVFSGETNFWRKKIENQQRQSADLYEKR